MYISRHIEKVIIKAMKNFPSVLITGPRQVGKSTLLKEVFGDLQYVLLDNNIALNSFKQDPLGFLQL